MECGMNMGFRPFHYLAEFLPIFYLLKFEVLNGRTRYYHSVEIAVLNIVKGFVECEQMLGGGVL